MIQLKKKAAAPAPDVLTGNGVIATDNLKQAYNAGSREFEFSSGLYGHDQVKNSLINLQDGKCCFCEAKLRHISHGDVEHFRPKAAWVQDNEPLNRPGYYWLAYDWNNLMLSCQICNQRYKKNFFPLLNPLQRATSHTANLNLEQPVFIHPTIDNPESFITFVDNVPKSIDANRKGAETIKKLQLDREELNDHRLAKLNPIRDLYSIANDIPKTNKEIKQRAIDTVKKYLEESKKDSCEYASMLRCFFSKNPLPEAV